MPEMDGVEALRRIRAGDPGVPVIMFSSHTSRGGATTLDALAAGASDYVLKPSAEGGTLTGPEAVRTQLVEKMRRLHERRVLRRERAPAPRLRPSSGEFVEALAIGSSTGGPTALDTLFRGLQGELPFAILIVQHMPPLFTKSLADRLARLSRIPVREAHEGAIVQPGTAWVAPGDHHMHVEREGPQTVLRITRGAPENSCRPSVDPLFRSVAAVYGRRALGLVLTGMGSDGLEGARHLVAAGGEVIVQDEPTSVVWGMPGAVAQAGLASRVLPLPDIAAEVLARAAHKVTP